jgi:Tol biopolymer transport system component
VSLSPGTRLGPYEIVASIGAGGMGEVFRARDTKLNREVAVKVLLNRDAADPSAAQRFQREAQAVAALNHPNIVTIYAIEEIEGVTFLAMELVEGRTLGAALPAGGLPLETVLGYGLQLADAVSAAHAQGITHRDLKPSNVMVTPSGRLKVLDFGLARLREQAAAHDVTVASPTLTGAGQIVGTVAYMSPEQASGTAVDHRSDLFSIGIILYELATGQRPFRGDSSVSVLAAILKDTPQPVSEVKPALPREFSRIVRRALAKDPEGRYQTAKDLRNDLAEVRDEFASGELTQPHPAAPASRVPWRPWHAVVAVLVILGLAAGLYYAQTSRGPKGEVSITRLTSTGHASLATISPDGKYVVHVVSDGQHSLWVRQTATGSNVQILPAADHRFIGLTFSPDGNYVYYTRFEGRAVSHVYRIPILGGTPEAIVRDVDSEVAFSPDGTRLAFLRGAPRALKVRLFVSNADGSGSPQQLAETGFDGFRMHASVAWSPDGRSIAVPAGGVNLAGRLANASIISVDAGSGAMRHFASPRWQSVLFADWIDDDTLVVSAQEPGKLNAQLWVVEGEDISRLTNDLNHYQSVSASRAGSLATVLGDVSSGLSVVTPGTGETVTSKVTGGSSAAEGQLGLAWMTTGELVHTAASAGQVDLWLRDTARNAARQLTRDASIESSPAVSPDDRAVVYKADGVGLLKYDVHSGRSSPLTSDPTDDTPAWTADGKQIMFVRARGEQMRIFRMNADGTGVTDAGPAGFGGRFSPNGRFLAALTLLNRGAVIGLIPTDGSRAEIGLNILSVPIILGWTASSDTLSFVESRRGPQTIWNQPIAGGPATQLLSMGGDRIYNFAWSKDGRLAVSHGPAPTDVVLLTNVR